MEEKNLHSSIIISLVAVFMCLFVVFFFLILY